MSEPGVDRRISFRQSLRNLNAAQKPGVGVPAYTRWVNRRAARYLAAFFCAVGATPSMVSFASIAATLVGLTAFLLFQPMPLAAAILAACLLALGYALDSADGQVARLQGSSSLQGEWLDHTLDAVRLPLIHLTIATALLMRDEQLSAVLAAAFSVIASAGFLSQNIGGLLRDQSNSARVAPRRFQSWALLPSDPGVLCWSFLLWPIPWFFATAYSVLFLLNLIHVSMSALRRWRELGEQR